jgi:hypothetical protein
MTVTLQEQAYASDRLSYLALELSNKSWKVGTASRPRIAPGTALLQQDLCNDWVKFVGITPYIVLSRGGWPLDMAS